MNYFKIFPNIKVVLGKVNALIHDLDRGSTELIPYDFAVILLELDRKIKIEEILSQYDENDQKIISENLRYVADKEYGIFCSEELFCCFPSMSLNFDEPNIISNAIIELKVSNIFNLNGYLLQLEELGCFDVSIILYETVSEKIFIDILQQIPQNRLKSVEIISMWYEQINNQFFSHINQFCSQITNLAFYAAPFDRIETLDREKNILFQRQFVTKILKNFTHCGQVELKNFNTNMPKFLEAINYNSCLHKKIAIDIEGNIKNCPAIVQSFGQIKNTRLKEALEKPGFKNYWSITKDHISTCKDCEFRYVCTDCRGYTQKNIVNEKGLDISKPLKCGYDPYSGKWEEWSSIPLKRV